MALNFPNDPSAQTPVNTFSPTSTPDASTNGVTYIYNASYDSWTAQSAGAAFDDDYLRLDASNGPITGALGVNGLFTAEDGITINQGGLSSTGVNDTAALTQITVGGYLVPAGSCQNTFTFYSNPGGGVSPSVRSIGYFADRQRAIIFL